jgi:hypothetical protein
MFVYLVYFYYERIEDNNNNNNNNNNNLNFKLVTLIVVKFNPESWVSKLTKSSVHECNT